jgi:1-aminocyclopropane-1-carboxylate deaminase/D-cysteine desulfhydrase-like pyridoxal-dependent ACC family enzyme
VRCTAAAAAKLGLHCHIQLEQRVSKNNHAYNHSGNVLLNHLFGATVTHYPRGEDEAGADASLERYAQSYRREGRKPYVIHLSMGHTPFGGVGYVDAAREILQQLTEQSLHVDTVVVASGSGHTHAGLLTGLRLANANIKVIGACVRREKTLQEQRITTLCSDIEKLLGIAPVVRRGDVVCDDRFLAPGYGQPGQAAIDAMKAAARFEGIIVDPVYTAKSMACAIAVAASAARNANTLYVHTGGVPALFGYEDTLTPILTEA